MKNEPLNLEALADKIIRVEYPTYEQTTIPQMKNAIIRKKQLIKQILEQVMQSVVQGLKEEIKHEKKAIESKAKYDDYYNGLRNGYIVATQLIKKWFPDIEP